MYVYMGRVYVVLQWWALVLGSEVVMPIFTQCVFYFEVGMPVREEEEENAVHTEV